MRAAVEDSKGWATASCHQVKEIYYYSMLIQAAYVKSLHDMPKRASFLKVSQVLEFSNHPRGRTINSMSPPYFIYRDHDRKELCVCVRGIRLDCPTDYWTLFFNRDGGKQYMDGFVHRGIYEAADWLLEKLKDHFLRFMKEEEAFRLVFVGHSLGAGIVSILALRLAVGHETFLSLPRERVKCFAFAPPRTMSLNLAVQSSDTINSTVLQDDFCPRISTSIITGPLYLLPCAFVSYLIRSFLKIENKNSRKLYPPGNLFHIVGKKSYICGVRSDYVLLTANPESARFDKFILSRTARLDHRIRAYGWALAEVDEHLKLERLEEKNKHPESSYNFH